MSNPRVNFDRELNALPSDAPKWAKDLHRNLFLNFEQAFRLLGGSQSATITVVSGGGSGGGGGSSPLTEYRAGAFSVAAGAAVVSFSSAMSSTSYRLFLIERAGGIMSQVDESTVTKSISGFGFTANEALTGYYIAIADA